MVMARVTELAKKFGVNLRAPVIFDAKANHAK